ncbi:MAG: beta strand repeat-containing protein [Stellaceae bacterium]
MRKRLNGTSLNPTGGRATRRVMRRGAIGAATAAVVLAGASGARAANFSCSWTDAGDNWTTTTDWSDCNATFPNNGAGNTYDATIPTGSPTLTTAISIGNVTVDSGGNWYVRGASAAATLSGNLMNGGDVDLDPFGGDGGASLTVGGTLTNTGYTQIGNGALGANTTLTAAAVGNTGTIDLYGNGTSQAALDVAGPAGLGTAGVISGQLNLQDNSLVQFGSGGLSSIAAGGQLSLNGPSAQVRIAGNTSNNNALTGLTSNAGYFYLRNGASLVTTSGLANSDDLLLDYFGGDGGSSLTVGGTLTNSGYTQIGNGALSANSTLTAAAVDNTGTIDLYGNGTSQAALDVAGPAGLGTAGVISGQLNLQGNSLVQFGSGGLSSIAAGGQLSLNGPSAQVRIAGNTSNNNALTGLTSNAGYFYLRNGASLVTTSGLANSDDLLLDYFGGDGGASLTVGGTLTNTGYTQIGNGALSANTTLTAAAVGNTGTIDLYGNGTSQAALDVAGPAGFGTAGVISGQLNLQGNSLVQFGSGGVSSIASGGQLSLNGPDAQVQIAGNTSNNNALTGLTSNAGYFYLRNGASLVTTSGLANSNDLLLDYFGGDGGASLTVGGTLTNSNYVQIGNSALGANTTLTAAAVSNTGTIDLYGNGTSQAALDVAGPATNSNTVNINASSAVNVTGGNSYTQTAGTTTIAANGALGAADVLVNGGTLQGNGTVTGNVTNNALVTGGINAQPGNLSIDGNFTNTAAGTVASYLSGSPSGNTQVTIGSGSPTLQGGTISGTPTIGFTYAAGQNFTVMNFAPGSLTGLFAGVANSTGTPTAGTSTNLGNGLTLGVVYNDHAGNIQLQVVNTPTSTADSWNGGTGNWGTAAGWSEGVPQFFSDVTVGATASGNVTLGQDATIESLAINTGNTLGYQATTPQTLTVGGNVTVNSGGALNLPTSGDKLALGGAFSNSGTTTLGADASLYDLGTFTNSAGTTSIGNGASVTTLGAASNQSGAQLTLTGGTLGAPSFANAGTTSGDGTIVPAIANTGLVEASGGTLNAQNGVAGATGNVTIDNGATLDVSHATVASSAATLAQNGTLALGGNNFGVSSDYTNANFGTGNSFNKRAGVTGTGEILAAGNVGQAVTGSQITGGGTATPTLALGNVHVDGSTSATYAIENTGTSGPALRGAIETGVNGGNITDPGLSGSGVTAQNFGPVATGAGTSTYTVSYNPTAAGPLGGQALHIANNFGNVSEQTVAITGAAYALASPTVASSLTPQFNFGVIQVGQTYTDPLTITNTLVANNAAYQEGLDASFGTPSTSFLSTNSGTLSNLAAGKSDDTSMVVTLTPTSTGTVSGSVPINFASDGATTSGLGISALTGQNLDYSWSFSGTVVNPANPNITPGSIDFGNVRIGTTQQQALSVANIAGTPPQASLDAQISASGAATSNGGMISLLAPGSSDSTSLIAGLNTASAGAQSGTATVALQSDSTPNGCTSNCTVELTSQDIAVKGNVYRLADPVLNTPTVTLAARVGDTAPSQAISISNSSPDSYTEGLKTGFGTISSPFTGSGTIANLAAQGTGTAMSVALDTNTAGSYSGTAAINYTSTGVGTDNAPDMSVGSGSVGLSGKVYTPAVASVATTSPIDFGILHIGDASGNASQNVTVQNGAAATALDDVMTGSISAGGTPFSGSGTLGAGLAAQQSSSALQVDLDTSTAGIFTGTAELHLASHDPDLADLALTTSPLSLKAQINNYASLAFGQTGGLGSLSGSGATYNLDFGNILQGSTSPQALLSILNDNPLDDQAFTDLLSSQASILSGSGFDFTGDSVSGLAGGDSQSGFDVGFGTASLGSFDELLSFDVESSNASGYDQVIGDVTLNLEGDIVSTAPVPEPSTIPLIASGLGMLFFVARWRRAR